MTSATDLVAPGIGQRSTAAEDGRPRPRWLAGNPLFCAFGQYVSSRPDLLPSALGAGLSDTAPPTPAEDVRRIIETELARSIDSAFESFDGVPFHTTLWTQSHRAWLSPTDPVTVKVVRRAAAEIDGEAEPLSSLAPVFAAVMTPGAFEAAIGDFLDQSRRRVNLRHEVASARLLAADARSFRALRAVRYYPEFCSDRVAVSERLARVPLDTPGFDRAAAARRVCLAWLRQALFGSVVPEEPEPDDFMLLGRGQVALAGGVFAALPAPTQAALQSYLTATAAGDPDWALECLAEELQAGQRADSNGLRGRFRHAPRSIGDDASSVSELLGEILFHWRLFDEHGFRPSRHLRVFYRGCLLAVRAAASIGGSGAGTGVDVLRDSIDVLQARIVLRQTELALGLSNLGGRSGADIVSRLIAETVAGGETVTGVAIPAQTAPRPARMGLVAALALALAAVGLVVPRLGPAVGPWGEPVGAAIYAVIGLIALLAVAGRPRGWWT